MESEDAKAEEIAALLADARAHVRRITGSLPTAVDPAGMMEWTTSKAPSWALTVREVQIWRAEEFARSACDMFERGDLVVGVSNVRGAVESIAVIWYLKGLMETAIGRGHADHDIYDKLRQLLLGSRTEEGMPQAINVIRMLRRVDKDVPGVWRDYERMSEVSHPNYQGALGVFGKPDYETLITTFGRGIRKNTYPAKLGLRVLAGSLALLEYAYNKIGELTEPFSRVCGPLAAPETNVKELFIAFRQQCIWLRDCYNTHEALYGSGTETTDLLERTAHHFFQDLSHVLREYCFLQVGRLTDRGDSNLTVSTLNAALDKAGMLSPEIADLCDGMLRYRTLINKSRNKLIAHADTKTILRGHALGEHSAAEVEKFFDCMQDYCDAVGRAVGEGPLDFRYSPGPGDVIDLLSVLRRGEKASPNQSAE